MRTDRPDSPGTHYIFLRAYFIEFLIMLRQECCYADDLDKIRCVEKRLSLTARAKVVFLVGGATELSKIKRKTVEEQCNTHA